MSEDLSISLKESLIEHGCLKFGEFTLKSGQVSNYYIDLRLSTYEPDLFHLTVESITSVIHNNYAPTQTTAITGVPYGVVPVAAAVAYQSRLPYFPLRKETKEYGNKDSVVDLGGREFIVIEDVMTTGSSIIETIRKLAPGKVVLVIVIVDREQGGPENIKSMFPEVKVFSILKASSLNNHVVAS